MEELIRIDILAHADFSARLRHTKRTPGYAAFATLVSNIRAENPENTLLLDAGDEFSDERWGGEPMVRAIELSGTDAMTLGNHEFDHGQAFLEECIKSASFPVLCANIHEKATGIPVRGTIPYVIVERSGVKIGILGLTTEYTPYMVTAASFAPYAVRSSVEACNKFIPQMRAQGAEIVVILAHFPFYINDDGAISGELYDVMKAIPPVDVFIGGHIPGDFAQNVCGTAVLKGGFGGKSLPHARLVFDMKKRRVVKSECFMHHTDPNAPREEVFQSYESKVTSPFDAFFNETLAVATQRYTLRLSAESKLGNFLADCVREGADTDIAYMNATSGGGTIEPGNVTCDDVTAVMGFNDPVYVSKLTGADVYALFELVYEPERFGNNAGLIYSGVIVWADHTKPAGSKIEKITLRDGTPLAADALYSVATSEYMASGGNDTSAVAGKLEWRRTELRVHEAIFAYLRKYGTLRVSPEVRMHEIGRPENDNSPF